MNPDIRIQDDLFGHVNGAWLDTAEIPADRSSWGPFVMLADTAEEHVREIIESAPTARSPATRRERGGGPQDRRPVRQLHGRGARRAARPHPDPAAARADRRPHRGRRARRLPRLLRAPRRRRAVRLLRRLRRPQLRALRRQRAPGRHRPSRRELLPRGEVRRDPREVPRLPRAASSPSPSGRTPRPPRPACWRWRPGSPRATGSARRPATCSRPTTSPPSRTSRRPCRASTSTRGSTPSAAPTRRSPRPWSGSRRTSPTSRRSSPTPRSRTGRRS